MTAVATEGATLVITEPVVDDDMPVDVYHRDPVAGGSLSCSGAKKLLPPSCPAIFAYEREHPPESTPTFDIGHAAHQRVLGVGPEIVVVPGERWDTKEAKAAVAAAREAGQVPVKADVMEQVDAMAAELRKHPIASALLTDGGRAESSLFWRDEASGVIRRCRLDWRPAAKTGRTIGVDYKGLALDTPLPTPAGWTTMRAVRVGDELFDVEGRVCRVTAKSDVHLRDCFRVGFEDGSSIVCDAEHRWLTLTTRDGNSGVEAGVHTADEIRRTLSKYGYRHHRVPVAEPLQLPEVALPIPPYVLGAWLGDGTCRSGRITGGDEEIFARIAEYGYRVGPSTPGDRCATRTVYGLSRQLRRVGLLGHKHIPDTYLRASAEQRTELLRGLLDTDGSWNHGRHQAVFTSVDKALATQVRELAVSLGQRAILHTYTARGFGLVREAYKVTFTPHGLNPFAISRKADAVTITSSPRSRRRIVHRVEPVPTMPTQCIEVDSPSRTYLCGDEMIPTHNTARSADPEKFARSAVDYGYHQQHAWYVDGLIACDLADTDAQFVFIVQEKTPPYVVSVVQLDAAAVRIGRALNRRAIDIYVQCTETGRWPGYSDDVAHVSLPYWFERQYEDLL